MKISKRIRAELQRYHRRTNRRALPSAAASSVPATPQSSTSTSTSPSPTNSPPSSSLYTTPIDLAVESTIITFLTANPDIEYAPGMVYLALTLAQWILVPPPPSLANLFSSDPNILLRESFAGALHVLGHLPSAVPVSRHNSVVSTPRDAARFPCTHRISQFLSTFRLMIPELASYFDDEGVGTWGDDWVVGWISWFCAKELGGKHNDEVKARLWDLYFAMGDGAGEEVHVYVCVALLKSCADAVEVLEQSEIRTLLGQFPDVEDVEGLLAEARRIKERVKVAEREEEDEYIANTSKKDLASTLEDGLV
jgi:Rab-GTPase-TBC domain